MLSFPVNSLKYLKFLHVVDLESDATILASTLTTLLGDVSNFLYKHKVSLAHNHYFWGQKLNHNVSFWLQKYC